MSEHLEISSGPRSTSGAMQAPWRRILCLVEFKDDCRKSLTEASHSALSYAKTLGVTHRARVSALHLVPRLPGTIAEQQTFVEQVTEDVRKHTVGQTIPAHDSTVRSRNGCGTRVGGTASHRNASCRAEHDGAQNRHRRARRSRIGSKLFGKTGQLLRDAKRPVLAVPVPDVAKQGTKQVGKVAA